MFNKECHICKPRVWCKERKGSGSKNMVIDKKIEHVHSPISLCPVAIGLMGLKNYMRRLKL